MGISGTSDTSILCPLLHQRSNILPYILRSFSWGQKGKRAKGQKGKNCVKVVVVCRVHVDDLVESDWLKRQHLVLFFFSILLYYCFKKVLPYLSTESNSLLYFYQLSCLCTGRSWHHPTFSNLGVELNPDVMPPLTTQRLWLKKKGCSSLPKSLSPSTLSTNAFLSAIPPSLSSCSFPSP